MRDRWRSRGREYNRPLIVRLARSLQAWFQDLPEERQGALLAGGAVFLLGLAFWRMGVVLSAHDGGASMVEAFFWCLLIIPLTLAVGIPVSYWASLLLEKHLTADREERLDEWLRRRLGRWLGE